MSSTAGGGVILVTGATGNVGLEVTRQLAQAGHRVRALVRDPQRGRALLEGNTAAAHGALDSRLASPGEQGLPLDPDLVDFVAYDFASGAPGTKLFDGARSVFLMRPPAISDVEDTMYPFLHAARREGIRQVVFLSVMGAQFAPFIPHRKLEKQIDHLSFSYDFLRAGFFMQNLDSVFAPFIRQDDEIVAPAGRGKTSFVDARDVGEAAANLLRAGGGEKRAFDLTGPEALDYYQVARRMSRVLGRRITYTKPGGREFRRRAEAAGFDSEYVAVISRLFLTVRLGVAGRVTGALGDILGRPPRNITTYLKDYKESWARS